MDNVLKKLRGEGLRSQLLRGGVGSIALKANYTILSFSLTIVLARQLGIEGYGVYSYAFALVTLLGIPANLGLPQLVTREIAAYDFKQQLGYLKGILRSSFQAVALMAVIFATVAGLIAWTCADKFSNQQLMTFGLALLLLPLIALGNLRGAALRGFRKVIQGQLPEQLLRPGLFFMLIVILPIVSSNTITPAMAMALHVVAAAFTFGIGTWMLIHSLPIKYKHVLPCYENRRWFTSALPLSFIASAQVINQQTDILMLGIFATAAEVGIYRVAVQGSMLVSFVLIALNSIMAPYISRFYTAGDLDRLQRMVTSSARMMLFSATAIVSILVFFGELILKIIFGIEYATAHMALSILCFGQLINAGMGSVGLILNMTGNERDTAVGLLIAAISNVFLNFMLIPRLGMEGAAIATALTLFIWNTVLCYKVWHRIRIWPSAIQFWKKLEF